MDASHALAQNVVNIKFQDIPAEAVRAAKMSILDTLGTTLAAGTLDDASHPVVDFVKEGGGKPESTIIGFGGQAPAWMAAFANSTMAHALDYDDSHEKAMTHGGIAIVPASFAMAERIGKVSGKAFIAAVVLGQDLAFRVSLATPKEPRDWHPSTVYGIFGVAAAAGKLLGLTVDQVQHALGIAYSQASGNRQAVSDASQTKRLEVGFASMGGILSALLAQKGITGAVNSLEGEFGLYKVYHRGVYDPAVLTSELGKRFEGVNLTFKPYPSGRGSHSSIDATLAMVREHDIKPGDVESITVFKASTPAKVLGEPVERKRRPENVIDAQFSIPYTVACAVVRRRVGLREITPEAIKDPAILDVAQKVSVQANPEFNKFKNTFIPGITEIRTTGGKVYSKRVDVTYGSPENPMPKEVFKQKFTDCASYAVKPLSGADLNKVIEMVMNLENVDDAGAIVRLLG
ncbi:MAG: MmgE/PrpD family protein [Chloroflexi bacterium]|nr:MmgE/PrpD family protein [Chloroflexota bacterium]